MIVNMNGRFVEPAEARVSINDGGFLFGDTLFETLKARAGVIRFLDEHLDRIELAAGLLAFPFTRDKVEEVLREAAEFIDAPVARLRLTITRGPFSGLDFPDGKQGEFIIQARQASEPTAEERRAGADCLFAPNARVNPLSHLPQMKRGNYADCLYAANFARRRGAREALFVDAEGNLLEGATSNLFVLREGTLVTPPAGELVLAGIMRRQVLKAAAALGLPAEERPLTTAELYDADEAFLTNAMIDLLPIAKVEGRPLRRGTVWEELLRAVESRD